MPPKKRDHSAESQKIPRCDQIQSDHELFLQAFEKPTQIYRYLRTRQIVSPIFLNRNLTYMRHRMSRNNAKRKNFKVMEILPKMEAQMARVAEFERPSGHMILTFTGYFDKATKESNQFVTVEAILLKICHKKRKDALSPVLQMSVGKCEVPKNPDSPPNTVMALSIPNDNFTLSNGHLVKSYILLITVYDDNSTSSCGDEPAAKKRKSKLEEPTYGAELVVYDKLQRCLLTDGEYQLILRDYTHTHSRKMSSWETFLDGKTVDEPNCGPFDVFKNGPLVTFHLSWSATIQNGPVVPPKSQINESFTVCKMRDGGNGLKNGLNCDLEKGNLNQKRRQRIFYQFLYNNNTRQQTEARDDLHCPWCSLNCHRLYSLLKHLKLCHGRFSFTYVPHARGARIDVSINECYDGSYVGNPQELHAHTGFAFSRLGPVRRMTVTEIMVCKPKRSQPSLSEFLEPDDLDLSVSRPYAVFGHNRLYYHTWTCQPIQPQEIDIDSEGENDPMWLRVKTQHMIDEFTDVNEGEKELMKLWNLHIMKFGFVGDCQIPLACSMFIEIHGEHLVRNSLCKNFVLHLTNLFDYGLIGASVLFNTVRQLQKLVSDYKEKYGGVAVAALKAIEPPKNVVVAT